MKFVCLTFMFSSVCSIVIQNGIWQSTSTIVNQPNKLPGPMLSLAFALCHAMPEATSPPRVPGIVQKCFVVALCMAEEVKINC